MPDKQEVRLEMMTRAEFQEARKGGHFQLAIIATGSIEQHLEHLTFGHDIASSTYIAERVARRLYPAVIVAAPIAIGISEHHMFAPGSLATKPGGWLAVVFDAVESMERHGVRKVLVLNGHGGNTTPAAAALPQWKMYFDREHPGSEVRVASYWDLVPQEFWKSVVESENVPGHAQEFETAFAMYAFPERLRQGPMARQEDREPVLATPEKGKIIVERIVDDVTQVCQDMMAGRSSGL